MQHLARDAMCHNSGIIKVMFRSSAEKDAMTIKAVIYEAEEGGYWAKVPSLPGVYTQAETLEELTANLREAIDLYLSDDSAANEEAAAENGQVLEIAV